MIKKIKIMELALLSNYTICGSEQQIILAVFSFAGNVTIEAVESFIDVLQFEQNEVIGDYCSNIDIIEQAKQLLPKLTR